MSKEEYEIDIWDDTGDHMVSMKLHGSTKAEAERWFGHMLVSIGRINQYLNDSEEKERLANQCELSVITREGERLNGMVWCRFTYGRHTDANGSLIEGLTEHCPIRRGNKHIEDAYWMEVKDEQ